MRLRIAGFLVCCIVYHGDLFACDDWSAKVVAVNGLVVVEPHAAGTSSPASSIAGRPSIKIDSIVCPGHRVLTGKNSRVALYLSNNSYMRLDQNSVLILPRQNRPDSFWIRLQQGVSHLISRINRRFEIDTPFVNAAVEGTEFLVAASASEASISVIEGRVTASRASSTSPEPVSPGQKLIAGATQSAYRVIQIEKNASVDWAIYYPPLFTLAQLEAAGQQRWLDAAAQQLRQARPDLALQDLDGADQGSPAVRVARAAVLLSVGQVESARDTLRGLQSANSLALQSIIFSSLNQGAEALTAARQAVATDPRSVPALVALSYAWQAQLQLPEALNAALSASSTAPRNPLAWSRVSELQLALGQTGSARTSAQRAFDLDPSDPQALTQLAFLNLFSLDLATAQDQFQQAIARDSENPQAHLGLGLALLRQGQLQQGRREIEIATSLDPARSVLRSYLGRAYFEEKRDAEAAVQWQLAKEFDPQDPTPWFYEGVRKLFANNPVGAIEELQVSRRLNDERALYRAETLLQSDASSRSATLARAYSEAGYEQGVRLAASDALLQDPANAEGHRLLADTYRGERRFEAARVSELQQAQLLQPVSSYPLQLQLSESDLGIVEGLGPSRPGLNEYHALFNQDQWNLWTNGLVGGDGTLADEIVLSHLQGPVSMSLGQYHYETDGFRKSAYQEQDIYNGFLQWQVTPLASVEVEYRDLSLDRGYLGLSEISTEKQLSRSLSTWRVGSYLQFSPAHGLLLSAITQQLEERSSEALQFGFQEFGSLKEDPWIVELKYLGRFELVNIQLGLGQYSADEKQASSVFGVSKQRTTHRNYYVYLESDINHYLALEAGLSYDDVEQEAENDVSQWSPKIGLSWRGDGWNLRTSAFRSFKRDLAANQTIEKTYVAGFNQVYSDLNSADSRNYALAFDYAPNSSLYTGLDLLRREVNFPGLVFDLATFELETQTLDYTEEYATLYLTWLFGEQTSLKLSYEFQQGNFDYVLAQDATNRVAASTTHLVPLTLRQTLGHYFAFQLTSRYVKQENDLNLLDESTFLSFVHSQRKETWLFDFTFESKLPRRRGVLEFGVKNLFDRKVEIVDETTDFLRFYPGRFVYARVQLHFH